VYPTPMTDDCFTRLITDESGKAISQAISQQTKMKKILGLILLCLLNQKWNSFRPARYRPKVPEVPFLLITGWGQFMSLRPTSLKLSVRTTW